MNTKTAHGKRVLIVGGGFAGLELAKALKKATVEVFMVDRHNYHTFQPLLYQVATGAIEAESIAFPIRRIFQKQRNFSFRMADVLKINPEKNTISTSVCEISYDYLVLATGAATNFFGDARLEHNTMGMKTVPEAMNLRSMILQNLETAVTEDDPEEKKALMTFVVVGGGPTGVELAGALAELKSHILTKDYPSLYEHQMKVYLVESKPNVLGVMSEEASKHAKKFLEQMGVIIFNSVRVKSYDGENLQINNGHSIRAKNVMWAAGVAGDIPEGLEATNIIRGNRIETDEINRVKSYENIFAIGDVATVVSTQTPDGHPGVAQVAIQQGKQLAKNIVAIINGKQPKPFKYVDRGSMATIGRNKAVADIGNIRLAGFIAWLLWCFVHLFSLIGFKNRLMVLFNWLGKYFSYNGSTRIIVRQFSRELMREDTAAK